MTIGTQNATTLGVFKQLRDIGCKIEPCGSRVTCSPVPSPDTDEDYLVEAPANKMQVLADLVATLSAAGFAWEGGEHYQMQLAGDFMSFRLKQYDGDGNEVKKDSLNFIVTANPHFAQKHRLATHVCKRLNLQVKDHRITVFQALLYDHEWNGKTKKQLEDEALFEDEKDKAF